MKIVVMVDGKPKGPFDLDALKQAIQQGEVSLSSSAWHEGRDGWTELQNIPAFQLRSPAQSPDATTGGS